MLLTSSKIRNSRLEICRSCKHFVDVTQSCGTLGFGERVKYKNTTKKLCGCIMPIKTHLKIASCPIHKWKSLIEDSDIKELKKLLGGIDKKISKEQNIQLTKLYNRITSKNNKISNCNSCVKKMVTEMRELLENI
tara:strand:+ start:2252 stop:2656 length:405 start_codon:yes stop_codon:yes gene_type:complete